eukprot:scaffold3700_cov387-Prasinococcus_capsulatus_cf.AAC.4
MTPGVNTRKACGMTLCTGKPSKFAEQSTGLPWASVGHHGNINGGGAAVFLALLQAVEPPYSRPVAHLRALLGARAPRRTPCQT